MPKLIKKFFFSLVAGLVLLFSFANYFEANAQIINGQNLSSGCVTVPSNQTTCTGSLTVACSQARPPAGNVSRWCCDTQANCDAAKGAVQQQITNKLASSPTTSTTSEAPAWYNTSFSDWYGKVYDPGNPSEIFGERYTAAQVQWVIYGLFSFLVNSVTGQENASLVQCFLSNTANINTCIDALKQKLATTNSIPIAQNIKPAENKNLWQLVFATDRPLSGIAYVKQTIENFSFIPVAHAQSVGFGYNALFPIQSLWRAVRDISFGLFVLAAMILAFMIMFRVKINPQTVITVQSAIPKVIIALILVTFSYAIAGFLIDLMYVVIGLISLAFGPFAGIMSGTPAQVFQFLTQGQASGANANFGIILLGALYIVSFAVAFILLLLYHIGLVGVAITVGVGGAVGTFLTGITGGLLPLLGILLLIIIAIIIIINFFKTMWSLLRAFAQIILLTIFAPIQIVAGVVIPNFGFGSWVRSFVSNLAVFVVTGVMLLFSFIFLAQGWTVGFSEWGVNANPILQMIFGQGIAQIFNANSGSAAWPPLLGGGNSASGVGLLLLGVSFVLFTMIPKANDLVQAAISGKPFAFGAAIGETIRPATYIGEQIVRSRGPQIVGEVKSRIDKRYPNLLPKTGKEAGEI